MPTYKHPCPHCGTFIERDVVACPACGRADPFAPGRCPTCNATVETGWIACPKCGTSLVAPPAETAEAAETAARPDAAGAAAAPTLTSPATCSGCGRALEPGARFCRECGTPVA